MTPTPDSQYSHEQWEKGKKRKGDRLIAKKLLAGTDDEGILSDIIPEEEQDLDSFFDETRELTEEDREGMKKLISSQQGAGEAFALKMNTEFGLRPGELKDVIKDTLEAVSGIPFVTIGREEAVDKIITKIAKELGDEPRYYYYPNEFKTLIGLLTSDELGVGLSKDPKRAQPTDEEINAGAKEFIKELYERIFEES